MYTKWRNFGLPRESVLYNFTAARQAIAEEGCAHLVEGPGCVWRLWEAGIRTAVASFGCVLTDEQQVLLEISGASRLVVLYDPDRGGRKGREAIRDRLGRLFRLEMPEISSDVGSMSVEEARKLR
jgi:DNA primase